MVHPNVLEAYEQAIRVLRKARIPYRETGGIALNFYGAGRPAKNVELIVRRTDLVTSYPGAEADCHGRARHSFWFAGRAGTKPCNDWTTWRSNQGLA